MELFSSASEQDHQPLAFRMRPRHLDEYMGQDHIIGEGRLLRRAIQADQLSSVIFYGPPGTGKTTLARVIANTTKSHFSTLNAVLSGVKQLREEIDAAKNRLDYYHKKTILFIDEVHRWNKSQQDALLPWVENGTVILIGATTENPYFEVNAALVSRSRIFQLTRLTEADLHDIAWQTLRDKERGYGNYDITFTEGALDHIINIANGDARSLLNALELAVETTPDVFPPREGEKIVITREVAEESIQQKIVLYDKEGDYHFDVISAFIKSIRGSDPDAVLYWMAKMVKAGEDPKYIFRRMLISASEDIGMADPHALGVVTSAAEAFDRVGMPEGRYHLTHAALYLATAPKSNSALGFFSALQHLEKESDAEVPNHLKDSSRDKEGFGHGKGYQYPHAYRDHWVAQQYLPGGLQGSVFYDPSDQGYEQTIRTLVQSRREAQLDAAVREPFPEVLTFSPPDSTRDHWLQRLITSRGETFAAIRSRLFVPLALQRHDRVLVFETGRGMLTWEACRQTPEGGVTTITGSRELKQEMTEYAKGLTELDRPQILDLPAIAEFTAEAVDGGFDALVGQNLFTRLEDPVHFSRELARTARQLSLCEIIPNRCQRLSQLCSDPEQRELMLEAEHQVYDDSSRPMMQLSEEYFSSLFREAGFQEVETRLMTVSERRKVSPDDIEKWFANTYGKAVPFEKLNLLEETRRSLESSYGGKVIDWQITLCFITAIGALQKKS